jgi:iron complex outermembrane receptor protein
VYIIHYFSVIPFTVMAETSLEYYEIELENLTQVITPTKLKQSTHDSPSSVSIITGELMMSLGIKTIPEALRLVLGMAVSMASGNDYRITYHGTNALLPRRMLVLIDGIPINRFGIARVDWMEFPILVDQIDRIEVTRSAAGTTYGANSFLAVVNVLTKHPLDYGQPSVSVTAGSLNTKTLHVSYGSNLGKTDYQISYSNQASDGFEENYLGQDRRDAFNLNRFSYKGITDISADVNMETQFLSTFGEIQNEFADIYQVNYPDIEAEDYLASAEITYDITSNNQLKLGARYISSERKQDWTSCPPAIVWLKELRDLFLINPMLAQEVMSGVTPDLTTLTTEESIAISNLQLKLNELGDAIYFSKCIYSIGRLRYDVKQAC